MFSFFFFLAVLHVQAFVGVAVSFFVLHTRYLVSME